MVIGRGDKADIRLVDDGISREHARIVKDGRADGARGPGLDERHLLQRRRA